jgi:hypothetical protein
MALLGVRRRLVDMRVEIDGQIRGILKTFGLVVGRGNKGAFAQRARMLAQDHPVLSALIDKLIEVREVGSSQPMPPASNSSSCFQFTFSRRNIIMLPRNKSDTLLG